MSDTIDQQLEHLADLHSEGALTDDEFAIAKANTLTGQGAAASGGSPTTPQTPNPTLDAPTPNISPKMVWASSSSRR